MKPEELDAIEARAALTARESRSGAATAHDVPALVTALRDAWRERDEALAWWNENRANVETANNVRAERDAALSNLAKSVEALRTCAEWIERYEAWSRGDVHGLSDNGVVRFEGMCASARDARAAEGEAKKDQRNRKRRSRRQIAPTATRDWCKAELERAKKGGGA